MRMKRQLLIFHQISFICEVLFESACHVLEVLFSFPLPYLSICIVDFDYLVYQELSFQLPQIQL